MTPPRGFVPPSSASELLRRYRGGERRFPGAFLNAQTLAKTQLPEVDLSDATLGAVNFTGAHLYRACLAGAHLEGALLCRTNLTQARLAGADMVGADLTGADVTEADFGGATVGKTMLLDLDLSALCDAEPPVRHTSPSTVDFRAILKSLRSARLGAFLRRTGMPEVFVEYNISCAQSVDGTIMKKLLRSTFISYGSPDAGFARKLYEALHRNGVTTFFFDEHAIPGKKLHHLMRDGVNAHDRVILVCSKASLDRKGVQNEIEEVLAREAREGGEALLIPIRLDDHVLSGWTPKNPGTAQAVRDRVVADFRGAEKDPDVFSAGLARVLAALKT